MAMTASAVAPTVASGAIISFGSRAQKPTNKVVHIAGLNSFGGLKAHNNVVSLGMPLGTEQGFAKIVSSLKAPSKRGGGGALSAQCSKIGEIFTIAAIINGLVLVGVAVGFVLLRVEALVEESEAE